MGFRFVGLDGLVLRRRALALLLAVVGATAGLAASASQSGAGTQLRLWKLNGGRATVASPRARGDAAFGEAAYTVQAATADTDPLASTEWWRADVHVDTLTSPGPGVPVTLVDSGVDFGHQEFAGRPNLIALNVQQPAPLGGVHGTATASVAGASVNGIGLVGIYPQSILRSYDASLGDGTALPADEIARGIVAATKAGKSVINLSLGGEEPDPAITAAIDLAVRAGSLVVAASGNSGDEGNQLSYPGASAHVLTIAATDESDRVAAFSTQSGWVDLAAPGVDIPVASALDNGYQSEDGTSFSSPMVAGAAAWLWTARPELNAGQVAEILRLSARDVGPPGYDNATGYGILDMAAALVAPTPPRDSAEPNDTIATAGTLSTSKHISASVAGRVAAFEDPLDVYRVWVPARKTLTARATAGAGVTIRLQAGSLAASTRLAAGKSVGGRQTLTFANTKRVGRNAYIVVSPTSGNRDTTYSLTTSAR